MFVRVRDLALAPDEPESLLAERAARRLGLSREDVPRVRVVRRSIDARRGRVRLVYSVEIDLAPGPAEQAVRNGAVPVEAVQVPELCPGTECLRGRVVVVGCGPAGLFAALTLARHGYRPLILERGAPVDERNFDVARFLERRELDPDSNIAFGAGGAGLYSDGKLRTRISDHRMRSVLETLASAGAPADILVDARPHIGSDRLGDVTRNLCELLTALGCEIRWRTTVTGLRVREGSLNGLVTTGGAIESNAAIFAVGAHAMDTFETLKGAGVALTSKPFQMGLRIEHPRELIDRAIYGRFAGSSRLGAAEYVLAAQGVTAFCVCPGGSLVAACAEPGTVCTNGMSNSRRDGQWTNAALVTTITPPRGVDEALAGIALQRRCERAAFRLAGGDYAAPAQNATDFLAGVSRPLAHRTSYPFGVVPRRLVEVIPRDVAARIARALAQFDRRIPGYAGNAAVLVGPETRASSPVRIERDPIRRTSRTLDGVYPCGEGSGYSSGIMSSAVDGIRTAETVIARFAVPR